jgi:hypothetical protein
MAEAHVEKPRSSALNDRPGHSSHRLKPGAKKSLLKRAKRTSANGQPQAGQPPRLCFGHRFGRAAIF